MEPTAAKAWKVIQSAAGPTAASWLDSLVSVILTKIRAYLAASIARDIPASETSSWQATRSQLRAARQEKTARQIAN